MVPTEKVLSQGILIWNIKAIALTVQMLLVRLNFSKMGQGQGHRVKNNGTHGKVVLQRKKGSYHKEYSFEISKL